MGKLRCPSTNGYAIIMAMKRFPGPILKDQKMGAGKIKILFINLDGEIRRQKNPFFKDQNNIKQMIVKKWFFKLYFPNGFIRKRGSKTTVLFEKGSI